MGVYFADEDPDVLWLHAMPYSSELLELGIPTVLEDVHVGPEVMFPLVREAMALPHVKVVSKSSKLTIPESSIHSEFQHLDVLHAIRGDMPEPYVRYPLLDPMYETKVVCLYNLMAWDSFRVTYWKEPQWEAPRPYDLMLSVGSCNLAEYPHEVVHWHRVKAVEAVAKLEGKFNVCFRKPGTPKWGWQAFLTAMRTSKMGIAPWGYDPLTCRDYELPLCGAISLRPSTEFMTTWPPLQYVPVLPDWSNLEEVVCNVRDNWEGYLDFRKQAYRDAVRGLDDRQLAERVVNMLRSIV
jgi:hypothetical protein